MTDSRYPRADTTEPAMQEEGPCKDMPPASGFNSCTSLCPSDPEKGLPSRFVKWKETLRVSRKLRQEDSLPELVVPSKAKTLPQLIPTLAYCWLFLVCGIGLSFNGPAIPSLLSVDSPVHVTEEQVSWIASVDALGCIVGGLLSGPLISTGRKTTYVILIFPVTTYWLIMAFAQNVWMIYASRFLSGACFGATSNAAQVYISEIAAQKTRGVLGSLPALSCSSGFIVCYVGGMYFDWQMLALLGACLAAPSFILLFLIPESPAYLMLKGHTEEAEAILKKLRGKDTDITLELSRLSSITKDKVEEDSDIRELFRPNILKPLAMMLFVSYLFRFCGIRVVQSYTNEILCKIGTNISPTIGMVIIGCFQVIGNILSLFGMSKVGRRVLLINSLLFMGLMVMTLGVLAIMKKKVQGFDLSEGYGWIPLVILAIYILAFGIGLSPLSGLLIGEILPVKHREITVSVNGVFSWFFAFVVTKTYSDMVNTQPFCFHGTLWFYAANCFVGCFVVYFFLPETRNKTLAQIQHKFDRRN